MVINSVLIFMLMFEILRFGSGSQRSTQTELSASALRFSELFQTFHFRVSVQTWAMRVQHPLWLQLKEMVENMVN